MQNFSKIRFRTSSVAVSPTKSPKSLQCRPDFKGDEFKGNPLFQSLHRIGKIIPYLSESCLVANVRHDQVLWACPHLSLNQ